jgi:hypothetical protein
VKSWSITNKTGVVSDQNHFDFQVTEKNLSPDAQGYLWPGEQVAALVDGLSVKDLTPFKRPDRVASVGPSDAPGWTPQTGCADMGFKGSGQKAHDVKVGNPHYAKGGNAIATPDSGRFSHPQLHPEEKPKQQLQGDLAGLDTLTKVLDEEIDRLDARAEKIRRDLENPDGPTDPK